MVELWRNKPSPTSKLLLLLCLANVLVPISIVIFATGFFPYKPFLPGLARYEDPGLGSPPRAPFDKIIFMVVDALRSDFVYSEKSGFSFTQSLIAGGAAIPYTAHATSPTITMPRVKAMTTGSIPSFLDVILNFAESDTTSSLAQQDTWLAQMRAKPDGRLIMYGDDTWLKLFPGVFSRADGTTSFFVSDFTEVDNNVTRHLPEELHRDDWNTMILHFLGLDHIGHKAGPGSPNMLPKQAEMDDVVKWIYQAIESENHLQSTLFVLCGDHGMNDAGNHGGSAPGEIFPALVFMSPKFQTISHGRDCPLMVAEDYRYYTVVEQSDIVPTLAGLLGFPVPLNNLGVFIPDMLAFWGNDDKIQLTLRNAFQILSMVKATFPDMSFDNQSIVQDCSQESSSLENLRCQWKSATELVGSVKRGANGLETYDDCLLSLMQFLRNAQQMMSNTASNYNLTRLRLGMTAAALAVLIASAASLPALCESGSTGLLFIALALAYGVMMFASSYVEEEQHFWYWCLSGWLAWLLLKRIRHDRRAMLRYTVLGGCLLAILRLLRRWNQTGQKFAGEPDMARTFFPEHNVVLWAAVSATFLDLTYRLSRRGLRQLTPSLATLFSIILCVTAFLFKVNFTNTEAPELLKDIPIPMRRQLEDMSLLTQARAVFLGLGLALGYNGTLELRKNSTNNKRSDAGVVFHDLLALMLVTQSRIANIPLFLLFEIQLRVLISFDLSTTEISTTSLLFQYASFFAFGGSNAISSIDLSNAYNGVRDYNVLVVGILTFVGNWAGPLWWASATTILLLQRDRRDPKRDLFRHLTLLTLFTVTSLLFVMVACSALRTHLFIWTVFSPKYLYIMAWCLAQHLCINVAGVSLLVWLGSR